MARKKKQKGKGSCLGVILKFFGFCLLLALYMVAWIPAIPALVYFIIRKKRPNRGRNIILSIVVILTSFALCVIGITQQPVEQNTVSTEQSIQTEVVTEVQSETEELQETEILTGTERITETENITEKESETESEKESEYVIKQEIITEPVTESELTETINKTFDLTIDVIDVGQGLSLLFESGGEYLLYDGGDRDYSSKVVACLKQKNIQTLDYVVVSHYDAEHLNGIVGALNVFNAEHVIAPDYTTDTRVYESFTEILQEKGITLAHPKVGTEFMLGNTTVTIIAPNDTTYDDVNDYSICLRLDCKDTSVIVTGDATVVSELEMLAGSQNLDADILIVGHHGSDSSTCSSFLNAVSPEAAVISCGEDNQYLHPSQEVMERLKAQGIAVYRTDKQGDFYITSDGSGYVFSVTSCNDYSPGEKQIVAEKTMYTTSDVNIRSEANTDCEVIGSILSGNTVDVAEINGDWATVIYNGGAAYVATAYLSDNKPVAETVPPVSTVEETQQSQTVTYILNVNTYKFHYPGCKSVKQMKESNKRESYDSREVVISQGFDPCGNCHP